MHQPEYADPNTGEFVLPWTRLHAVKDYDEFADVLADHPGIRSTVNLTPVLCGQIESIAAGVKDVYQILSEKPASYLTQIEREFILSNFFKANFETMIRPYERYSELYFERGRNATPAHIHEAAKTFGVQKLRDLQVWANLAWSGVRNRQKEPVIRELIAKGRHYTDEEKETLMDVHRRICSGVLAKYRRLQEAGIIEISTTPYYHPILPILLDMKDAQIAHPGLALPRQTRPFADDARWQVESALAYAERTFGRRPAGMWPSEGSVSEKTCDLLASCGVRWSATDERILEKSLNGAAVSSSPPALARPYVFETAHGPIRLFFRNHDLSDRIGFTYGAMPVEDAVSDFVARVESAGGGAGADTAVSVILDGENAWEYFRGGSCQPFLSALFTRLKQSGIVTRTCGDCASSDQPAAEPLPRLSPGSWINGNFNIWIGHPEDNAGWDAVQTVRIAVDRMPAGAARDRAMKLLRIAEGSDWYWWFGDDHSSEDDPMFDRLFRDNLIAACRLAGATVPPELMAPIKRAQMVTEAKPATEPFTPAIDGMIRPFYEWLGAGRVDISYIAGAMHKAIYHLERFYWGFDETSFYFCLEMTAVPPGAEVRLFFRTDGGEFTAILPVSDSAGIARLVCPDGECRLTSAYREVLEVEVPLSVLKLSPGRHASLAISVVVEEMEIERWPVGKVFDLQVPDPLYFSAQWVV